MDSVKYKKIRNERGEVWHIFIIISYVELFSLLFRAFSTPPPFYAKYMHDFKHTDFIRMNNSKRREKENSR